MRAALILFCAAALLTPAHASSYPQANRYYQVRDKAQQIVETWQPAELQLHARRFAGKLVEVRGTVTGCAGSDSQRTLLIASGEGLPTIAVSVAGATLDPEWSFLDVGAAVRCLCRVVVMEGGASGSLEVVIPVREEEAAAVDREREKLRAAAVQRAQRTERPLASRGVGAGAYRAAAAAGRAGGGAASLRGYSWNQLVSQYSGAVRHFNPRLSPTDAQALANIILNYSVRYGLDARLVMAVIAVESNFNANAVSPVGAMGLGQLMPGTASDLGVGNAFDVRENLEGSTRLLSQHVRNMSPDGRVTEEAVKLALACYNAGAGAVKKHKGIPPYRETQNYVTKITRLYRQMCGLEER